jgi:5-enolpyruvylshikimate-3-phosphate synthase
MLTITAAKEIKGHVSIPPSQDLFFLALIIACASRCPSRITPLISSPRVDAWIETMKRHAEVVAEASSYRIEPSGSGDNAPPQLSYQDIPYRDFAVCSLLGRFGALRFDSLPKRRFDQWRSLIERTGCRLREESLSGAQGIILDESDKFHIPDKIVESDDAQAFLGLALGLRKPIVCTIDAPFQSPLRHVLPCFGFECSVVSLNQKKDEDPLIRRMRFLKTGKKSEGPLQFSLSVDFSKDPARQAELTLPGDEILSSLIIAAKCLVPKGSLIVENVSLETWSTPLLQFLKNMGAALGTQETGRSSFGSVGSVVVQKINPFGRKVDCRPRYQFASQLPIMVVMAMFAQGQSIFRNLEDLRNDEPDGIDCLNACISTLGARFGEMPDGIVVEGAKQFDGFDLKAPLPSPIAGAFAVAGLKCRGTTTIADDLLAKRWPDFETILRSITQFKE